MEIFTEALSQELLEFLPNALAMAREFAGQLAIEGLKLVLRPFYEFSMVSCIVAIGWIAIFWRNKQLLMDGLLALRD